MNSRILIVEDNSAISDLLSTLLTRNDIENRCVDSVEEAQAVLAADDGFDLLLTDIVMPGNMDGLGLAKWASARHPSMRIGLMSGYRASNDGEVDIPVLAKPFREYDLLEYLQQRLADDAPH